MHERSEARLVAKKALLVLLGLSFVMEAFLTVAGFVSTDWMIVQFKLSVTSDTQFMGYVVAWMLMFIGAIAGLAFWLVRRGDRAGWTLSYLLGIWWVGIGIGIFAAFGRPDNLALDSAKGLLILVSAWLSRQTVQTDS